MKKLLLHILVAILMVAPIVGVASGCKGSGSVKIDKTKTQLLVANYSGGVGTVWLDNAIARFEEKYKDISFEEGKKGVQVIPAHDIRFAGGTLTNTILADNNEIYFTAGAHYDDWVLNGKMKDITNVVKNITNEDDGKTIESKFFESDKQAMNLNGKYYAIPHYTIYQGLTYDAGLFANKDLFFGTEVGNDGLREFVNAMHPEKSCGPDGITGNYDDGLPSSIQEFYKLIDKMLGSNVTPLVYRPSHYTSMLPSAVFTNLLGADGVRTMYSFNSGDKELDIVQSVNADGSVNSYKTKITEDNGYLMKQTTAFYYALEFAHRLFSDPACRDVRTNQSAFEHTDADKAFLSSGLDNTYQHVAMLIEGDYWYNEASDYGIIDSWKKQYSKTYMQKDPKFMPIPRLYAGTVYEGQGSAPVMVDSSNSYCIVNPNVTEDKMDLVEKFISFVYSDAELLNFTNDSRGITRGLNYDYSSVTGLSNFGKSVFDMRLAADEAGTYVRENAVSMIAKRNSATLSLSSTSEFMGCKGYQYVAGAFVNGLSLKKAFEDMKITQSEWNSSYNIYN